MAIAVTKIATRMRNPFAQERLAQSMFDHIPVGVGSKGVIPMTASDLEAALEMGVDWSLREGYAWAEDKEHCEEYGRMLSADSTKVPHPSPSIQGVGGPPVDPSGSLWPPLAPSGPLGVHGPWGPRPFPVKRNSP